MTTQARVQELLNYDPATGVWTWRVARGGRLAGSLAGQQTTERSQIRVDGVLYLASRLAVLYMTGAWPADKVDHKDTNPRNNRWANLRGADHAQNATNVRLRKDNSTGLKGVSWHKATRKWVAAAQKNCRRTHLGLFDCPAAAHLAYVVAAGALHGEYANFG